MVTEISVNAASEVRTDLFAVQVYEDCGEKAGWVVKAIHRNQAAANKHKQDIILYDQRRHFPLMAPKITHPKQAIVDVYLLYGNTIRE
jgi:hypothetical protein